MSTLKFDHPHIQTNIYDNSQIVPETTISNIPALFQPYFSEKGQSDEIIEFNDLNEFLSKTGTPNLKKYGQAQYNITNWLKSGGKVYAVRLVADDSTYANVGLNVRTKAIVETINGVEVKKVAVKLETVKLPELTDASDDTMRVLVNDLSNAEDGYTDHIVFVMRSDGKGKYGNNYSIRVSTENAYNKTYPFKCYRFSLITTSNDGSTKNVEGPAVFSFYPEAATSAGFGLSLSNTIKNYFAGIKCYFNEDGYDKLLDDIMEATDSAYDNAYSCDFIFGDSYCDVDRTGAVSLFTVNGTYFEDGDDGSIGNKATDTETIKVRNALLEKVYKGISYPDVFDKQKFPIDVVLDANFDISIKNIMNEFVLSRGDCIGIFDTGEIATPEATVAWKEANITWTDYLSSIWSQAVKLYDTYSVSDVTMTPTYVLAGIIPANDFSYGIQYAFVGPNRGVITGVDSVNWSPTEDQKELLYDANINYIEDNYRSTRFMSQTTMLDKKTALSDINHVRSMLKIVRSTEELMENFLFEFATDDTLSLMEESLNNMLSEWVTNGTCKSCSGKVSQTALEAENKTAHVTVSIVFVDVIEKIIIDINIGR